MDFKALVILCFVMLGLSGCGCDEPWEQVEKRILLVSGKKLTLQLKTFNRCHAASGHNLVDWTTNHLTFSASYGQEQQTFYQSKPNWTARYLKSKKFWSAIKINAVEDRLNITHSGETKKNWSFVVSFSPLQIVPQNPDN